MSSLVTSVVINYYINTNPDLFPDTAPRYMGDTGVKIKTPELNFIDLLERSLDHKS